MPRVRAWRLRKARGRASTHDSLGLRWARPTLPTARIDLDNCKFDFRAKIDFNLGVGWLRSSETRRTRTSQARRRAPPGPLEEELRHRLPVGRKGLADAALRLAAYYVANRMDSREDFCHVVGIDVAADRNTDLSLEKARACAYAHGCGYRGFTGVGSSFFKGLAKVAHTLCTAL